MKLEVFESFVTTVIKKVIDNNEQSMNSLTYLKEASNWDHSALGTAQP